MFRMVRMISPIAKSDKKLREMMRRIVRALKKRVLESLTKEANGVQFAGLTYLHYRRLC